MLSKETLTQYGADVAVGLARCMNNEEFYYELIKIGVTDEKFASLHQALEEKNLDDAFEYAHALKGVIANLAITPIHTPLNEITELLRDRKDVDYSSLYNQMEEQRKKLLALID